MIENPKPGNNDIPPEPETGAKVEIAAIPGTERNQKPRKLIDFWLGFIGCIIGNAILASLVIFLRNYLHIPALQTINLTIWLVLPWVVNIGVIIFLLIKRRWHIVFGILAAIASILLFAACLVATCFSMLGSL